ncbi:MAG: FAD-dependent monooxygenase [Polyangiales bacterium]
MQSQDWEVAIIGGGPAGLSTALFLAHAAPELTDRIVVLEKERYPRDKICGGAIGARGDKLLASIGVEVDVPSVQVAELALRTSFGEAAARVPHLGRVVRRVEFDHALARSAQRRGIRIIEGAQIEQLEVSHGAVQLDGTAGRFRARVAIGADGVGGFVRRAMGLSAGRFRAQVIELDTEPVASDRARDSLRFDFFDPAFTGYAWDFPTLVDGKPLVCRGIYHLKLDDTKHDIAALLAQRLARLGLSIADYQIKRFAERGFETRQSFARPHVALVGEAAGIDGFSGEGIPQAIEYGAFAGRYLAEKLRTGDLSFRDWDKRLAKAKPGYDLVMREGLMQRYYTGRRELFDRYYTALPGFVQCTAEQLAGLPISNLLFLREAAGASLRALGDKLMPRLGRTSRS